MIFGKQDRHVPPKGRRLIHDTLEDADVKKKKKKKTSHGWVSCFDDLMIWLWVIVWRDSVVYSVCSGYSTTSQHGTTCNSCACFICVLLMVLFMYPVSSWCLEFNAKHAFIRDELSKGRYDPAITQICHKIAFELFHRTCKWLPNSIS